jgi:hypothetical protein
MWVEEGVGTAAFVIPHVFVEASVVMDFASANRSLVALRFAFFGLGLPFVSYKDAVPAKEKETEQVSRRKKQLIIIM